MTMKTSTNNINLTPIHYDPLKVKYKSVDQTVNEKKNCSNIRCAI